MVAVYKSKKYDDINGVLENLCMSLGMFIEDDDVRDVIDAIVYGVFFPNEKQFEDEKVFHSNEAKKKYPKYA